MFGRICIEAWELPVNNVFSAISLSLIAGEQHGFRKAKNIKFALDGEFYFFSKVFGFDAPGIDVDVSLKCNLTIFP